MQAPEEWHDKVDDPNVLVFDCRNEFESEVWPHPLLYPIHTFHDLPVPPINMALSPLSQTRYPTVFIHIT
jgi:predicted sulfurtransferase